MAEAKKKAEAEEKKAQAEKALMKELSIMISESVRFRFLQKNTANIIKNNKVGKFFVDCIFTKNKKLVTTTEKSTEPYQSFNFYQLLNNVDESWRKISQSLWSKNDYYVFVAENNGNYILFPKRDLSMYPTEKFDEIYTGIAIVEMLMAKDSLKKKAVLSNGGLTMGSPEL